MQMVYHESSTRGLADHGWLVSRHTFSFAQYHDPERMNFGLLRVLNDDMVKPAMGFGTHPHDNMEIISIPLKGSLRHKDSMGNSHVISAGEVQIMSAGSGLTHSEYNNSETDSVEFLQIWVFPKERDIQPRYDQLRFDAAHRQNRFQVIVSPDKSDKAVSIHQDAWFSLADLTAGGELTYHKKLQQNGAYFFILSGEGTIQEQQLKSRDGLGFFEGDGFQIEAREDLKLLVIEIPINTQN